jgi:hypothetical protein
VETAAGSASRASTALRQKPGEDALWGAVLAVVEDGARRSLDEDVRRRVARCLPRCGRGRGLAKLLLDARRWWGLGVGAVVSARSAVVMATADAEVSASAWELRAWSLPVVSPCDVAASCSGVGSARTRTGARRGDRGKDRDTAGSWARSVPKLPAWTMSSAR